MSQSKAHRIVLRHAFAFLAMLAVPALAVAAEDAGQSHDYRTFLEGGKIEYGQIGDSYTADLVMYLAGNQFSIPVLSNSTIST